MDSLNIEGIDIVAIICIVVFAGLIYTGHNSSIPTLLSTIVGYYFGRKSVAEAVKAAKS